VGSLSPHSHASSLEACVRAWVCVPAQSPSRPHIIRHRSRCGPRHAPRPPPNPFPLPLPVGITHHDAAGLVVVEQVQVPQRHHNLHHIGPRLNQVPSFHGATIGGWKGAIVPRATVQVVNVPVRLIRLPRPDCVDACAEKGGGVGGLRESSQRFAHDP